MNNNFENIVSKGRSITLSEKEREDLRAKLQSYMTASPANARPAAAAGGAEAARGWYLLRFQAFLNVRTAIVAALVLLFATSGVAFAARGALPGDVLYPVKVGVNEKLQSALALSAKARAQVAVSQALARIDEMEKLEAKGSLDAEKQETLQAKFAEKSSDAARSIAVLQSNGDADAAASISAEFDNKLRTHERVLAVLTSRVDDLDGRVGVLAARMGTDASENASANGSGNVYGKRSGDDGSRAIVPAAAKISGSSSVSVSATVGVQADARSSVEASKARASTTIGEINSLMGKVTSAEAKARISGGVSEAAKAYADAEIDLKAGRLDSAADLFKRAIDKAAEARKLIDLSAGANAGASTSATTSASTSNAGSGATIGGVINKIGL